MKTYSETQGIKPFDWNKALNDSKKDWNMLFVMSKNWITCACGNTCDIIPRNKYGAPLDSELRNLGAMFCGAIYSNKTTKSKKILKQIETRSAELINELTK